MKELNDLNNIYQKMYDVDEAYTVTAADKKGNTPAWKGYKAGKKNVKTGKPLYKAADHLKNEEVEPVNEVAPVVAVAGKAALAGGAWAAGEAGAKKLLDKKKKGVSDRNKDKKEEIEISSEVEKLIESGLFSDAEIAKIADIQEADIADILARLEKKRISKGGDPEESPLPAMRKYHADKKKKAKK